MTDRADLFIDCRSELGEGPFWHPGIRRLFWFDILNQMLFGADDKGTITHRISFRETVSAAGIVDDDTLVVASASGFVKLDLRSEMKTVLAPLEPERPRNRPNDGRVNPAGGFWIGTMSRRGGADPGAGSVYQFRKGKVEKLFGDITIPNSTCFSPDGGRAYFADTETGRILTCRIKPKSGRPDGKWKLFAAADRGSPDGSAVDSEGYLWNARWGGSCVVRHAPDGSVDRTIELPVSRVTCPAFGGKDLRTLYITSAREGMTEEELAREPHAGSIFAIRVDVPGLPETPVKL